MSAQDPYGGRSGQSAVDPASARTVDEFVTCLRRLKVWAGDPSFELLRRRSGVPSSTLADALRPDRTRLPRLEVVSRFVSACGGTAEDLIGWEAAWRRVRERVVPPSTPRSPIEQPGAPHQLPGGPSHLAGRREVLRRLDTMHRLPPGPVGPRTRLALIVGSAGVGKTALALYSAHRSAAEYPDGQLYVDLLGAATQPAIDPGDALVFLLTALGLPAADVPAELGARIARYRSLTYARRMLVVLDNARDGAHVRPLLPGGPRCTTMVTSRNRLSALLAHEGGVRLTLAPLPVADAVHLIRFMLGDSRVDHEPGAVRDLVHLCGCLPLALRIAAANLVDRPQWSIAEYVAQLGAGNRLAQLSLAGDEATAVQAAFDLSYAKLPGPTQQLFRRLASVAEPDFTVDEAIAVTGQPRAEVYRQVEALAAAHLVEAVGRERYTMHDLLRLYAADLAGARG